MRLTQRVLNIGTETSFEVLALARELERQGKNIVHLEIGEPDFDTPAHIKEAAKAALDRGETHYTTALASLPVRHAVAEFAGRQRGVEISPDEIMLLPGGKPAILMTCLSLLEAGDEAIIPVPAYPIYESAVRFVGAKPALIPLREENDFRFEVKDLAAAITPHTRLLILNSPHNPCGSILTREDLVAVAELAKKHDLMVLSDEIYAQVIYDGLKSFSIMSLDGMKERTILLDGFSKAYAMTGWRLGFTVAPKILIERFAKLAINIYSCISVFNQDAALAAVRGPQDSVKEMVAEFQRRRDFIHQALNNIRGVVCRKPSGAFYIFPNVKSFGKSSKELMQYLLNEAGVACLHGTAFGQAGEGYLRFSYANSMDKLEEGMRRVKTALERI